MPEGTIFLIFEGELVAFKLNLYYSFIKAYVLSTSTQFLLGKEAFDSDGAVYDK